MPFIPLIVGALIGIFVWSHPNPWHHPPAQQHYHYRGR
jgi:hypothetical protein